MKIGEGSKTGAGEERVLVNAGAGAGAVEIPLLTNANYHVWALVMQVSLEALELWDVVEVESKERAKDRRELAAILRGVPFEIKAALAVKESAKEAWDAVKTMRVGDDRVQAASVQRLWKEFEGITFNDGESVSDFAMRVNGIVASLRQQGEVLEDPRVVKKMLRIVPKKFKQVAVAIEMFSDLKTAKIEELVGRLRVAEDAHADEEKEVTPGPERLLLTEEQWEERRSRRHRRERARGEGGRRGANKKEGRGGGHDEDDDGASTCSGSSTCSARRHRGRCFTCGEHGHIARDCPKSKREKAMFADVEEEAALL